MSGKRELSFDSETKLIWVLSSACEESFSTGFTLTFWITPAFEKSLRVLLSIPMFTGFP